MKIAVFPNLKKKNAYDCTLECCDILNRLGAGIYIDCCFKDTFSELSYLNFRKTNEMLEICDIVLVVGGDGTILHCAKLVAPYEKPIIGINSGRLGFMASLEANELDSLEKLFKNDYQIVNHMLLDVRRVSQDGCEEIFSALNDATVSRNYNCKITDFEVSINGQVVSFLRADGVIFSTPTGSTAYSLSAGGPIIDPEMECIEFTQICPFSLFARTMIFSPDKTVKVIFRSNKNAVGMLSIDGQDCGEFLTTDTLYISKSDRYIKFIDITGCNFYHSVNSKLMQPLKGISQEDEQ